MQTRWVRSCPWITCVLALVAAAACGEVKAIPDAAIEPDAAPDAPPDAPVAEMRTIMVVSSGDGMGTITSNPAGLDCGANCTTTVPAGTLVTLTAAPGVGSTFGGWGGACGGSITTCSIQVDENVVVNADFGIALVPVTVMKMGAGSGTVTSDPAGIDCGMACSDSVVYASTLRLTAAADPGAYFLGWGGACTGTARDAACVLMPTAAASAVATFVPLRTLTVARAGNGGGAVTAAAATPGIDCGADCTEDYPDATMVTLSAMPDAVSNFTGWSGGGCTGTADCTVTMDMAQTVTATFDLKRYTLDVTVTNTGAGVAGTVSSSPAGITSCGAGGATTSACVEDYNHGTVVTLTATPNNLGVFDAWGGACANVIGTTCQVTMDQARSVTASFKALVVGLTVTLAGTGSGQVTSSPGGILCGTAPNDCFQDFAAGTVVTLTAAPLSSSTFNAWSGITCNQGNTSAVCTFTMPTGSVAAAATFTLRSYVLQVNTTGGAGTVSSSPAGILNCGGASPDCAESYTHGSVIQLVASPGVGHSFVQWTNAPGCTTSLTCSVTLTQALTVTAQFQINQYPLTVTRAGTGTGTVTSSPAGISCGSDCAQDYNYNTVVTLTAAASTANASASTFTGWSGGACAGSTSPTCAVTVTQATAVTATFALNPNIAFVTSTTSTGALGGLANADMICAQRATAAGLQGTYRAWLTIASASALSRLGSSSGWVRRDGLPFARSVNDLTAGRIVYPLRRNESNADVGEALVWTGAFSSGSSGQTCNNWTVNLNTVVGTAGDTASGGPRWSRVTEVACNMPARLICLGIDRNAPIGSPRPSGRFAFVSAGTLDGRMSYGGAVGVAGADELCRDEATAANLPGRFRALLATNGAAPSARFSSVTGPWNRVDGVRLFGPSITSQALLWDAPINVLASGGGYVGSVTVWTGSSGISVAGTVTSTCGNWTLNLNVANGTSGIAGSSAVPTALGEDPTSPCNVPRRVYCLRDD